MSWKLNDLHQKSVFDVNEENKTHSSAPGCVLNVAPLFHKTNIYFPS